VRYLLERFELQIQKFERTPEIARQYEEDLTGALDLELRDLYVQLFLRIRGLIGTSRLIIIPHGVLHLLPFHLFRNERYLFEDFAVSYSPSASMATYGLAKSDVCGRSTTIINTIKGAPLVALGRTPGITDEIRVFEHDQATRKNFDQAAAGSAYLAISSQIVFRQDNPILSGFRLSDGLVSAIELYSTVCNANVVALDVQYTGARHNDSPEVMLAVPRAFLYAGARSVLMPLWEVADPSTGQLLAAFYDNIQSGNSRPEALARAMKSIRAVHPHPYFWGSFLLLGR
jgi:CHAT domain-containing protein